MMKFITVLSLILLGSAAPATAQGVSCSTPEPVVGEVSMRWVAAPPLNSAGSMVPAYFQWTAPLAGDYWFDTRLAIGGTILSAGIDAGCSTVFTHSVNGGQGNGFTLAGVQAGDTYLVNSEVANTFGHPENEGALNVVHLTGACQGLATDTFEPNDGSYQGPRLDNGSYIGLWASNSDWDYYTTCLAPGATMQVDAIFSHVDGNLDLDLAVLDPV
ncbi:MAG: hypothetical protein P1V35_04405, partial [Planctomycetota bacterium]|nr:hypothetical protein [Planctomycetota bacterium]